LARLARHRHVAAHHARELAGDGKAEPGAAEAQRGRGIDLGKLLEYYSANCALSSRRRCSICSSVKSAIGIFGFDLEMSGDQQGDETHEHGRVLRCHILQRSLAVLHPRIKNVRKKLVAELVAASLWASGSAIMTH